MFIAASFIIGPKLEIIQMSILKSKQTQFKIFENGILLSNKQESTNKLCNNIEEYKNIEKEKKDTKEHISCDFIFIISK